MQVLMTVDKDAEGHVTTHKLMDVGYVSVCVLCQHAAHGGCVAAQSGHT